MGKWYYTVQGDMFDGIAKKHYGDERVGVAIMQANPEYMDMVIFPANVKLWMPDYELSSTSKQPPWRA
ncbi:MAG: tail protein X [Candidatus Cloacimonetes bacterium]|nr:tail protein X [Candidatus Cloacimonadota bacterium]